MNIAYLLTPKHRVAYLYDDNTIRQGLEKLRHHGRSAVPVINRKGQYVGTVRITASVDELLDTIVRQNFVPVVDDLNSFIGIVTRQDIIRCLAEEKEAQPTLRKIV